MNAHARGGGPRAGSNSGKADVRQNSQNPATTQLPTGEYWSDATRERNWLVYKLVPRPGKKPAKHPAGPRTGKAPVSVHDAACLTFHEALSGLDRLGEPYGLGYLPRPGSTLIGGDLDDCVKDGAIAPWAAELISHCWSWVERSPSGTGLRVIAARRSMSAIDTEGNGVGLFAGGGRFFTITFDVLSAAEQFPPGHRSCYPERKPSICSIPELAWRILDRIGGVKPVPSQTSWTPVRQPDDAPHWFESLPPERQDEEVERMLAHLTDSTYGQYENWLRISFSVYRATDSCGFEIWDRWCQQLPNYHAEKNAAKWGSGFSDAHYQGRAVTVGTLIMHARQNGYRPPFDAWSPGSPFAGIARPHDPEEIAGFEARFRENLAKRRVSR